MSEGDTKNKPLQCTLLLTYVQNSIQSTHSLASRLANLTLNNSVRDRNGPEWRHCIVRYFNSITEAAEMLGVNTQILRWLLESGYVLGEYSRGRWSIPVDNLMQKKENGSLLCAIQTAEYKLKPRRHRRSRHNYRQRKTHRSYVRASK